MQRKFEKSIKEAIALKVTQDNVVSEIIKDYPFTFKMIFHLLKTIFGLKSCRLNFVNKYFGDNRPAQWIFKVQNKTQLYWIYIIDDIIVIQINNEEYRFKFELFGDKVYAELQSYVIYKQDKILVKSFINHRLVCEKRTSTHIYQLDISYDSDDTLDSFILNELLKVLNIEDLRKLYLNRFYPYQKVWEKNEKNEVSISEIRDNKQVVMDRYKFNSKGRVSEYLLSTRVGNMIVKKEGLFSFIDDNKKDMGTFNIVNYDANSNLNPILKSLDKRSLKINDIPSIRK